jgi:hypothetical protein
MMLERRVLAPIAIVGLLLALALPGLPSVMAQDGEARQERPERFEPDPQRLRAMLDRRLESLREQEARVIEIMDRLDAGESPREIFAELRERGELGVLGLLAERGREGVRGPMGEPGPEDRDRRAPQAMNPEDYTLWRNRVMAFFEEHAPEMAQRLREAGDSEDARRAVFRLRREVERLIELKERESEEFRPALERLRNGVRIADLLGRVRQAKLDGSLTEEALGQLRRELTEIVGRQYDAQLAAREEFLRRTTQRLEGAREKLEQERAERSQRIEAEVQSMIDRATREGDGGGRPGGPRRRPN